MIKIVSGWSNPGGSTTAFINLCNLFNENGYDCTFYGPHKWHLDKCKSDLIGNVKLENDDSLIFHYIDLGNRPPINNKILLVSHEKWWFKPGQIRQYWDTCVFLHEQHKEYHSDYKNDCVIIPNLKSTLEKKDKPSRKNIAGVIGTLEERKQNHVSVQRALDDGCDKVFLFGRNGDDNYYNNFIKPILSDKVVHMDHTEDRQSMYDSIGCVYHSSNGEVASLVKDECYATGTEFFGNKETENVVSVLEDEEVLKLWLKVLEIC
jgi:hypothetical protein